MKSAPPVSPRSWIIGGSKGRRSVLIRRLEGGWGFHEVRGPGRDINGGVEE